MSAFPLDPLFNDFLFVGGTMTLVPSNSIAETVQELNCRFGFGKGEWFGDLRQGFPWMQAVLGVKNPEVRAIAQMIRVMMLATPGVASIVSLPISFNAPKRTLNWTAQARHQTGNYIVGGAGKPFIVATLQTTSAA